MPSHLYLLLHLHPFRNLLRLTVECGDSDNYKIYINSEFLTSVPTTGFVPDQYKLEMKDTPTDSGDFQAEWLSLEFRFAFKDWSICIIL